MDDCAGQQDEQQRDTLKPYLQRWLNLLAQSNLDRETRRKEQDCVRLANTMPERVQRMVPSCEGDLDAGHTASMREAVQHIDETLHAENGFLDTCDAAEIQARMQYLAGLQHASALQQAEAREAPAAGIGAEPSGVDYDQPDVSMLPDAPTLEAHFQLRFLNTRQHKLQVRTPACNAPPRLFATSQARLAPLTTADPGHGCSSAT